MRLSKSICLAVVLALIYVCGSAGEDNDFTGKQAQLNGHTYRQRDETFVSGQQDGKGRTNVQRMEQGLAPLDRNGEPVQLHHADQKNEGARIELTASEHRQMKHPLRESEIDRNEFTKERERYWKERAKDFRLDSASQNASTGSKQQVEEKTPISPVKERCFLGKVIELVDGDVLRIKRNDNGQIVETKLYGVHCRDTEATKAIYFNAKLLGKGIEVALEEPRIDKKGRTIATIYYNEEDNGSDYYERRLSVDLVRAGFLKWDRKTAAQDRQLQQAEDEAFNAHRGLWVDTVSDLPTGVKASVMEKGRTQTIETGRTSNRHR